MTLVAAYTNPGVTVTEASNPNVGALLATPNGIAILGDSAGSQSSTDKIVLNDTSNGTNTGTVNNTTGLVADYPLTYTGVSASTAVVVNVTQNTTVDAGNYRVYETSDPNSSITGDEVYSIHRIPAPTTAPTVTASGIISGGITGTYAYAVSFVTPSGIVGETTVGPSTQVSLTGQQAYVTNIEVGPTGTTARNIYRASVTGSTVGTFHYVGTISNNTAGQTFYDSTANATVLAAATAKNGISPGDTVTVTYSYTDQNYYEPTYFDNYQDVIAKYGAPFDANGDINSELSFAIRMAFINGATEVIGLAREASDTNYAIALPKLFEIPEIAFVSVASGDSADHAALQAHCTTAATTYGLYRQCIVGQDSSNQVITVASLQAAARAYNDANVILVSPSSFNITNPVSLKPYAIGAQYAAAGVAGMFAARDATVPLTRKTIAGFTSPNETRTTSQAQADSAAGLMVIEYKGGVFRVRHGVTTAIGNINTAEASVVRAKYVLAYELKNGLDGLIGVTVPVDQAAPLVASNVNNLLSALVSSGLISSYANLSARLLGAPTTVEVAFEYAPIYPINNINVIFTINTQTGGFALTQQ